MADVGRMILPSGRKEAASHDRSNGCESMQGHREKTGKRPLRSGSLLPGIRAAQACSIPLRYPQGEQANTARAVASIPRRHRMMLVGAADAISWYVAYPGAKLAPGILAQAQINDGGFVVLDMRQHAIIGRHQRQSPGACRTIPLYKGI
jgi:hypothetical protein